MPKTIKTEHYYVISEALIKINVAEEHLKRARELIESIHEDKIFERVHKESLRLFADKIEQKFMVKKYRSDHIYILPKEWEELKKQEGIE